MFCVGVGYISPPASDDCLAALSDLAELPLELLPVDVVVGHDGVERCAVHHQAGRAIGVPTINIYNITSNIMHFITYII